MIYVCFFFVKSPVAKKAEPPKKKGKQATKWELNGTNRDMVNLDFSDANGAAEAAVNAQNEMPSQEEVGSKYVNHVAYTNMHILTSFDFQVIKKIP